MLTVWPSALRATRPIWEVPPPLEVRLLEPLLPVAEDEVEELTPMVGEPMGASWLTLPWLPRAWEVMLQSI